MLVGDTTFIVLYLLLCLLIGVSVANGVLQNELYWALSYILVGFTILGALIYWVFWCGSRGVRVAWNTHNGSKYVFKLDGL